MNDLSSLVAQALDEVTGVGDLAALDEARVRWLGKKGTLTEQLKSLGALPAAERPAAGQKINEAKLSVQSALDERRLVLERAEIESKLAAGRIDVTLPGRGEERGGHRAASQDQRRRHDEPSHSGNLRAVLFKRHSGRNGMVQLSFPAATHA